VEIHRPSTTDAAAAELPELFDVGVRARSLGYLYAAGAALAVLTLVLPHSSEVDETAVAVLAGIAVAIAALLLWRAGDAREWVLHLGVATGTVMISLANLAVGMSLLYPILYSWAALYSFYFFEMRQALAQLVLIGVAYAVVLVIQDGPVVRWPLAVGTPAVAGFVVARLMGGLRAQAARAEARARELRESETRTRLLLDSAPDAFVAIDAREGAVTAWNRASERLFGWSEAEVLGRPLRDVIFPPEGRAAHDDRRRRLLGGSEPLTVGERELELQRRDGTCFPAEVTLHRVVAGDDVVISAFVRDLTERRRREEDREALRGERTARAEAERVAEMVSGMQLLVDAALAHRTTSDILPDLVARVRGVLQADVATIYLSEEGRLLERASSGSLNGGEPALADSGESFAGRVAAAREPILAPEGPASQAPAEGAALLGIPLLAGVRVTGVLVVGAAEPRRFTDEDVALLRLAADRVALGIDRARVYEREHNIAERLQRSLLPDRLPRLPGLAVAARYLPAAPEAEVGGDWYDVIPIPGGRVAMVMSDVAGKGLAAASTVGRLRSALRAYALEGHGPAAAVAQLNRLIWSEAEEGRMATLLYAIVDPGEGEVCWVNAGHMPPLLVAEGGRPEFLGGARSVPLGVLPFPSFREVTAPLAAGSTLLLYTDGLVERPGAVIDEGMSRLADAGAGAGTEPAGLCDRLMRELVPAGGATDDVALLALRNVPLGDRFEMEFPAEPEALSSMRGLLRRWLRHAGAGDQETAEILTACSEAATNAIEHAGAGGDEPFAVAAGLEGRTVRLTVSDRGTWRSARSGDQGRGLSLMRALMDTVEVSPGPAGTQVRLARELRGIG
jgi:PAS domain S-box-containing protein